MYEDRDQFKKLRSHALSLIQSVVLMMKRYFKQYGKQQRNKLKNSMKNKYED